MHTVRYHFFPSLILLIGSVMSLAEKQINTGEHYQTVFNMYDTYKAEAYPDAPDVTVEQYLQWKKTNDVSVVLVDVRKKKEMAVSLLPGAISKKEFTNNKSQYQDAKIVAYCTIGYRSGEYTERLRKNGYEAYNLIGSALAWAHAGHRFVTPDGDTTNTLHVYGKTWDLLPQGYKSVW